MPIREYCKNKGLEIFKEYIDEGESGRKTSRPALDQMLRDAGHKRFNQIIVWKMDRLSRAGIKHVLDVLDYLKKYGVSVVSVTEPAIYRLANERVSAFNPGWCAKMESQDISRRVKAGIEWYKKEKGYWGRPRVKVTSEDVKELRVKGLSYRAISKELGISLGKVQQLCVQKTSRKA